jgi:hypothetical protein
VRSGRLFLPGRVPLGHRMSTVRHLANTTIAAQSLVRWLMSAGFRVAGEVFWGTNGAVETYIEALAAQAAARLGPDDPLAAFFRDEREAFSAGRVVSIDGWLGEAAGRGRFLDILDAATDQLLGDGAFTEYGREWVASVVAQLRARIAGDGGD